MIATRSRMLPPARPPPACMHDCDRQDHTLREGLTEKLSRLRWDVWVGNGHGPRSSPPIRRNRAVSLEHLHDRDLALICLKSTHVAAIISSRIYCESCFAPDLAGVGAAGFPWYIDPL